MQGTGIDGVRGAGKVRMAVTGAAREIAFERSATAHLVTGLYRDRSTGSSVGACLSQLARSVMTASFDVRRSGAIVQGC